MARKKRALSKSATTTKVTPPTTTTARAQAELARAMREDAQRVVNSLTRLSTNAPLDADAELTEAEFLARATAQFQAAGSRAEPKWTMFDIVNDLAGVNSSAVPKQLPLMFWVFIHVFTLLDTFGPRVWRMDPGFDPVIQVIIAAFAPFVCLQVLLVRVIVYGCQKMVELTAAGNKKMSAYVMAELGPASAKSLQPMLRSMPLAFQLLSLVSIYTAAHVMVWVWKIFSSAKVPLRASMEIYKELMKTAKEKIQRAILLGEDGGKNRNAMAIRAIRHCGVAQWIMRRADAPAKEANGDHPQQQPQPMVLDTVIVKHEVAPVYPVVHLAAPQYFVEEI